MIKFDSLEQAVIAAKKEEFYSEVVSCSRKRFPGFKGYSIRNILDDYNKIMGLDDERAYIWKYFDYCYSLSDLRYSISQNVSGYTDELFDKAVSNIGILDFDFPSAYALIAKFIRKYNESINEMILCLRQYGYEYTQYSHKNGKCTINTSILLEALESQISEERMHLVKIFTFIFGCPIEKLIYTNAPDDVIINICNQIKEDDLLDEENKINGVLEVLSARGYKYKIVGCIPQYRV